MSVILLDAHAFTPPINVDTDGDALAQAMFRQRMLGTPAVAAATFVGIYDRTTGHAFVLKDRWGKPRTSSLRDLFTLARDRLHEHLEADWSADPDAH